MSYTEPKHTDSPNQLRRKIFRGAYGGVGVLMAVQAKTALGAGVCASPSAILSGNTSPRPDTGTSCAGGFSPGYWKQPQKAGSWTRIGAVFPTFNGIADVCSINGQRALGLNDINTQGTTLNSAGFLGGAPDGTGIWAVIAFPGSFSGGQLLRHLAAAWLNAGYFTTPGQLYPLTRVQIIEMWDATKSGGLYCPTSMTCASNTGWTAQQVIDYIEGMYHINSDGDPDLCVITP